MPEDADEMPERKAMRESEEKSDEAMRVFNRVACACEEAKRDGDFASLRALYGEAAEAGLAAHAAYRAYMEARGAWLFACAEKGIVVA